MKIRIAKNNEQYALLREQLRGRFNINEKGYLTQEFNGITFCLYKGIAYFSCSVGKLQGISMHVYVWQYYNGPVPKGYHVHHIDGDQYNNDIANLEIKTAKEHLILHGKKNFEANRQWYLDLHKRIGDAQKEWARSESAKVFHSTVNKKNGHKKWDNWPVRKNTCKECGIEFEYKCLQVAKFCSSKCKNMYGIKNQKYLKEKECRNCKNKFKTRQVGSKGFCSQQCWREYKKNNK